MKIKARIHEAFKEPEIHVCHCEMTPQVAELLEDLKRMYGGQLIGMDENGDKCMLAEQQISRFYAQEAKVYAKTEEGVYVIPQKLYELEQQLESSGFLRISKAEIVNIRKIQRVDMNIAGTIKVIMRDGTETYTSRRNVTRLKNALEKSIGYGTRSREMVKEMKVKRSDKK